MTYNKNSDPDLFWFEGRFNRLDYLIFWLLLVTSTGIIKLFENIPIYVLIFLAIVEIEITAKRLRDLNISGYWSLLRYIWLPFIFILEEPTSLIPIFIIMLLQTLLFFWKGNIGTNRFGDSLTYIKFKK